MRTCVVAYIYVVCTYICTYMYINTYICSSRGMLDVSGKCCLLEFFGWTLLKYLFIAPPTIKAISDITLQNLCKFIQNNILFTLLWNVSAMRWDFFQTFIRLDGSKDLFGAAWNQVYVLKKENPLVAFVIIWWLII